MSEYSSFEDFLLFMVASRSAPLEFISKALDSMNIFSFFLYKRSTQINPTFPVKESTMRKKDTMRRKEMGKKGIMSTL